MVFMANTPAKIEAAGYEVPPQGRPSVTGFSELFKERILPNGNERQLTLSLAQRARALSAEPVSTGAPGWERQTTLSGLRAEILGDSEDPDGSVGALPLIWAMQQYPAATEDQILEITGAIERQSPTGSAAFHEFIGTVERLEELVESPDLENEERQMAYDALRLLALHIPTMANTSLGSRGEARLLTYAVLPMPQNINVVASDPEQSIPYGQANEGVEDIAGEMSYALYSNLLSLRQQQSELGLPYFKFPKVDHGDGSWSANVLIEQIRPDITVLGRAELLVGRKGSLRRREVIKSALDTQANVIQCRRAIIAVLEQIGIPREEATVRTKQVMDSEIGFEDPTITNVDIISAAKREIIERMEEELSDQKMDEILTRLGAERIREGHPLQAKDDSRRIGLIRLIEEFAGSVKGKIEEPKFVLQLVAAAIELTDMPPIQGRVRRLQISDVSKI